MTNEELAELERQIERLAQFIMHKIPGEPSQSEGAVDAAIRIMGDQAREAEALRARLHRLYTIILENSPDTTIADNGMTVWDGLHNEARAALEQGDVAILRAERNEP